MGPARTSPRTRVPVRLSMCTLRSLCRACRLRWTPFAAGLRLLWVVACPRLVAVLAASTPRRALSSVQSVRLDANKRVLVLL
eukprot:6490632-Amphidinium_carterae.2